MSSEEGKLFVGGLNFNTDEQALEDHFSSFGPISEVVVVKDRETQRSRGFGFITFTNPEHASDAMRAMNGEVVESADLRAWPGEDLVSLPGWTLKPQTKRGVYLAPIVGQLRGVGRRTQPEFSQDVSSSRGARWIQVMLWGSVAPEKALLVRGACDGTWHPQPGAQQEFRGSFAHLPCPLLTSPLPCVTTHLSSLCLLAPSLWMVARSAWTMPASLPGAEVVALEGVVAATLEVVETRVMGVAGMTVGLEDMAMDMEDPETMVAEARVVMTATQEEITETITTTEMRHGTPNVDTKTQGIKLLIQDRPSKWLYL